MAARLLLACLASAGALTLRPGLAPRSKLAAARLSMKAASPEVSHGVCVQLDEKDLPDCIDKTIRGTWYACDAPPQDDAALVCFQLEDEPATPDVDGQQGWYCVQRDSWQTHLDKEDSY